MTDFERLALPYFAPLLASWTAKTGWPCRIVTGQPDQPDSQEACKFLSFTSYQKDQRNDASLLSFGSSPWHLESETEIDGVVVTDSWTFHNANTEPAAVECISTGVQTSAAQSSDHAASTLLPWIDRQQSVPPLHTSPTRLATPSSILPLTSNPYIHLISPARQKQFNPAARATLMAYMPPNMPNHSAASTSSPAPTPTASSSVSASRTKVTIRLPGRSISSREMPPPERPRERHSPLPPRQIRFKPRDATPATLSASSTLVPTTLSKAPASSSKSHRSASLTKSSRQSTPAETRAIVATNFRDASPALTRLTVTGSPGTSKHTSPDPMVSSIPEALASRPPDFFTAPFPQSSITPPPGFSTTPLPDFSTPPPPESSILTSLEPDSSTTLPPNPRTTSPAPDSGVTPPSNSQEPSTTSHSPDSATFPPSNSQESSTTSRATDFSPESSTSSPLLETRISRQCSDCNSAIQNVTRAGRTRRSRLAAASADLCSACSLYTALNNRRRPDQSGVSLSAPPTSKKQSSDKGRKRPRPSGPENKSPARRRKHRRLTENEDVSSGASEPSTLVEEVVITHEQFTGKMKPLVKMLQDANYSFVIGSDEPAAPKWKKVVNSWLAIEYIFLSEHNAKGLNVPANAPVALPSLNRPECMHHWIQRARRTNWRAHRAGGTGVDSKVIENVPHVVGKLQDIDEQFYRWWKHLKEAHEESVTTDQAPVLVCPGLNGLLSVVSVLFFWAEGIQELENEEVDNSVDAIAKLKREWVDAVADVSATLNSLLDEMKTA